MKLLEILKEMPRFGRIGKTVVDMKSGVELKRMDTAEIDDDNLVLYVQKTPHPFFSEGWFMIWFTIDPEYPDKLNRDEADMVLFPPKIPFHNSPITDLWKKRVAGRYTDTIIGACQGWVDAEKKTLYVNMLSVRPGWKRNGVATHMFNGLKKAFAGYDVTVSKTTNDGAKFFNHYPPENRPKEDDKDYNPF